MKKWLNEYMWFFLLGLGLCFVCIGIVRREHIAVLEKAIMICLECIGIG